MAELGADRVLTTDGPTDERIKLADETGRLREQRRLSKRRLAEMANYTFKPVAGIENPDKQLPSAEVVVAVDKALNAGGLLIRLRQHAYDAHMKRREALKKVTAGAAAIVLPGDALDTMQEILERIILEQVDYVDSEVADELERLVARSIVDYDVKHSAVLAPDVTRVSRLVDRLLQGKQYPGILEQLQAVGCQFSGVLSKISVDLNELDRARVYALQSYTRANRLGDPNLRAWSRGMQSRVASGAGDFARAVDLARQPGKHSGQQAARLAFDEARALAKMGDQKGVDNAVERGMSSSCTTINEVDNLTLASYDFTQSGRWACYAYATVGAADKAQEYAEYSLQMFDRKALPSGAAIRMELATTLAWSDPSQAGELVIAAMDYTTKHPWANIIPRIKNFLIAARSPKVRDVPAIRNAVDAARGVLLG